MGPGGTEHPADEANTNDRNDRRVPGDTTDRQQCAAQQDDGSSRRGTGGVGRGGRPTGQEVDGLGDVAVRGRDSDIERRAGRRRAAMRGWSR